jgi:hypothetical protein
MPPGQIRQVLGVVQTSSLTNERWWGVQLTAAHDASNTAQLKKKLCLII